VEQKELFVPLLKQVQTVLFLKKNKMEQSEPFVQKGPGAKMALDENQKQAMRIRKNN
jgi:hypothetical protein